MSTIIIDQVFLDEKYSKSFLRREISCDLVPSVGMEIEEEVWEKPKKIKKVNINPSKNQYVVFVEDEFVTKKTVEKVLEGYKKCGWKPVE